jgi:hypothetical protein
MATSTCLHCDREVLPGRRYCTAHYMHALEVYQEPPLGYGSRKSSRDAAGNPELRNDPLAWYAVCFGTMVGGTTWLALRMQLHLDNLRGFGVLVACLAASTLFPPVRRLVGRYMRVMLRGVFYCGGLAGLVFLLSHLSEVVDARSSMLYWIAIGLGIALSILAEILSFRRGQP